MKWSIKTLQVCSMWGSITVGAKFPILIDHDNERNILLVYSYKHYLTMSDDTVLNSMIRFIIRKILFTANYILRFIL